MFEHSAPVKRYQTVADALRADPGISMGEAAVRGATYPCIASVRGVAVSPGRGAACTAIIKIVAGRDEWFVTGPLDKTYVERGNIIKIAVTAA